jgi:hypothetical protein
MSLPKRHIEVEPETPVGEIAELIEQPSDRVEFRIGGHLLVLHRSDSPAEQEPSPLDQSVNDGVDGLLKIAGSMKGIIAGETLKSYIYEMRDQDIEREQRLAQARSSVE